MAAFRYPMKYVVQQTGLSPHVLRVWERRYGAVHPERSETNRRLYTDEEVRRLELLASLSQSGHGISQIATLSTDQLAEMANREEAAPPSQSGPEKANDLDPAAEFLALAWTHVLGLEPSKLQDVLEDATVAMGTTSALESLVIPLLNRIGAAWDTGEISPAEEHAASAVIKEMIFLGSRPFTESAGAPNIIATTPAGQLHELGAAMITAAARRLGWNVTYLGPSLPAEEIARAAIRSEAIAVALSVVYPSDDPQLPDELRRLRKHLPEGMPILIGGRAAHAYLDVIKHIGATFLTDIPSFKGELAHIRERRSPS